MFFGSQGGGGTEKEGSEDEEKEKVEGIRHWTKMAEEEGNGGGRPSGGNAEGEDDVVRRWRAGCGSKPVSGRAKKEDEARRNNQLTYGSRAAFTGSCSFA